MAKATKSRNTGKGFRGNTLMLVAIVAVAAVLFALCLTLLTKFFQTETYYVLKEDIPTRTQVTPEMLSPVTTSEGTAPKAAIGLADVQTGNVYTQYPLLAGDILTHSNVGALEDIATGIPDSWVVTNFSVPADSAVGGRVQRGTYFDIMVTNESGSFYPFVNVLALDTTVDLSNASSSQAADSAEAHAGQTTQYVVGMSPQDAAKLQNIVQKYGNGNIKLVLSPRQNEYSKPQLGSYDGLFTYSSTDGVIWPGKGDNGEVTDYTFSSVKRDAFGRPVEQVENCGQGNAKVNGESCNTNPGASASPSADSSSTTNGENGTPSTSPTKK